MSSLPNSYDRLEENDEFPAPHTEDFPIPRSVVNNRHRLLHPANVRDESPETSLLRTNANSDADELDEGDGTPLNRNHAAKKAARVVTSATGKGIALAQHALGTKGTIGVIAAVAAGGAAAVGTGGAILAAGAVAVTVAQNVAARRSAQKTLRHVESLDALYKNRSQYLGSEHCMHIDENGSKVRSDQAVRMHAIVADQVLPYVLAQKRKKLIDKTRTARYPIIAGALITMRSAAHKAGKTFSNKLGVSRSRAGALLAEHLLECDCELAQLIAADLYSEKEMQDWLDDGRYADVATALSAKMKCTG
jgi:hypothetical protein